MNDTVSNQTAAKCQHCSGWTNYADDAHHQQRMERLDRYGRALAEIANSTGSDDPCRTLVEIAREALKQ